MDQMVTIKMIATSFEVAICIELKSITCAANIVEFVKGILPHLAEVLLLPAWKQ